MLIRPVTHNDHDAVLSLADAAGIGMTSLPANGDVLAEKIDKAVKSFARDERIMGQEIYLFVLENPETGEVAGTTGIKAHVGLNQPFYSYKLTTITQQSKELDIFSKHALLQVTNDLTGASEISSLFLLPQYRRDRLGRLLSLCRFLFIAAFPDFFSDTIIAELRGYHDPVGNSPFYDSIARHFFEMEFPKADYINATQGNQFINDLMPKYPIYVDLLPKQAQNVIGEPHPNSAPAKAMLEKQGFRWQGYIDVFDGGPTLQVDKSLLKAVEASKRAIVGTIEDQLECTKSVVSNERFADFRSTGGRLQENPDGTVTIQSNAARYLNVSVGDPIRYIPQSL